MRHSQRDYFVKRHMYFGPIVLADHQFTEAWFIFQIHMVLVFDNYLKLSKIISLHFSYTCFGNVVYVLKQEKWIMRP